MKSFLAVAAAGLIVLSAPALAQDAGSAGASGVGGGMSGSNTGSAPATMNNDSNKLGGSTGTMNEGRATSPDQTNTPMDNSNDAPNTVRGDQNGQGVAK